MREAAVPSSHTEERFGGAQRCFELGKFVSGAVDGFKSTSQTTGTRCAFVTILDHEPVGARWKSLP